MATSPRAGGYRMIALAVLVGLGHAVVITALVGHRDYPVNTLAHAPGGTGGALLGLVALLAVPTFVTVRFQLVLPLFTAILAGGWPIYREFTTPAPEFSTLGGHTVMDGTLYVNAYVDAWYVWLFATLLVGLGEYVVRTDQDWLPAPKRERRLDSALHRDTRTALRTGLVIAAGHVAVFLLLAADWGYFAPDGFLPSPWYAGLAVLVWTVLGLAVIGAVAAVLLVRVRLVAPMGGLAWLVWRTGWTQNMPLPDDTLPIYFLGWFVFAVALLAVGGVEYVLRVVGQRASRQSTAD